MRYPLGDPRRGMGGAERIRDETKISERYDAGTEKEANAFAFEFLMPRALWEQRADVDRPTLGIISTLAAEFRGELRRKRYSIREALPGARLCRVRAGQPRQVGSLLLRICR